MGSMRYPDFYIVGAPKSATTALYEYLQPHPELFLPDFKEPHYFGSDIEVRRHRTTLERYLNLYSAATEKQLIGDGSVWYLYSEFAASEIRAVAPAARIIIMLRNPLDMIASLHSHQVFNGVEDLSLPEALDAEEDRAAGRRIPPQAHFAGGLLYRRAATYSPQVERYLNAFGTEQTRIFLYDDMQADARATYRSTLEFLGVDPNVDPALRVVNRNKVARAMWARRFVNAPPAWLRRAGRTVVPARLRHRVYQQMVTLNARSQRREEMSPQLRAELAASFGPELTRLSALIGRDLSAWTAT